MRSADVAAGWGELREMVEQTIFYLGTSETTQCCASGTQGAVITTKPMDAPVNNEANLLHVEALIQGFSDPRMATY